MTGAPHPAGGLHISAERDATRARHLEQLHASLAEQVAALQTGDGWQAWLRVATKLPDYSLNNLLLIAAQRPDATAVAGFGAWKALGRQVNKGSKGIAILAPVRHRPTAAHALGAAPSETVADAGQDGHEQGGEPPGGGVPGREPEGGAAQQGAAAGRGSVGGFKVVHVFDVSQTSGPPLPERPAPVLLAGQAPTGLWDALADQVQARGFTLARGDCGAANGVTDYVTRIVTVWVGVDDAQAVKTLAHELGHVLLHDPTGLATVTTPGLALHAGEPVLAAAIAGTSAGQCRGRAEVEAESMAFLVANAHGLDTGAYTFAYVAGWASDVTGSTVEQVVRGTANRVLAAARVVLSGTDHLLAPAGVGRGLQPVQALHSDTSRGAERTIALRADGARDADRTLALLAGTISTADHAGRSSALPQSSAAGLEAAAAAVAAEAGPKPDRPTLGGPAAEAHPQATDREPERLTTTPDRLIEIHALTVDFYVRRLHAGGPEARRAVALLSERGIERGAAGSARLGYAPRGWTSLVDHLRSTGVTDSELVASGLVLASSRGTLVDRFRDRVVFPVDTVTGQTVALLGRAVDETATDRSGAPVPKYLNSPDTGLYRKGEHLYGLSVAADALTAGATPVLVEGPMDVLAINRATATHDGGGMAHVGIAPCGTALTESQVSRLNAATGGLAKSGIIVAFDGDDAGRQAAVRAFDLLSAFGAWPHALHMPDGEDPASLALQHGAAGLRAALLSAAGKPLADLVIDDRLAQYDLRWAEGQIAGARSASALVATLPPQHVPRQIARIIGHTGLDTRTVGDLVVDAVTSRSQPPSHDVGTTWHKTAGRLGTYGPSPRTTTTQEALLPATTPPLDAVPGPPSPAQRAKAGFPQPLATAQLSPPTAADPLTPPRVSSPDRQRGPRTA